MASCTLNFQFYFVSMHIIWYLSFEFFHTIAFFLGLKISLVVFISLSPVKHYPVITLLKSKVLHVSAI